MKKEVLLAIFAGIAAGLFLAFGVWKLTSNLKKNGSNTPDSTPSAKQTSTPSTNPQISIAVSNFKNLDVVYSLPTKITGLTKPSSIVIVSSDEKDYKTKAGTDGSFETEISLSGGLNYLILTSFDQDGESAKTEVVLVYSSEFAKYIEDDDLSREATDSADAIRDKVQQKLNATVNKPTAYVGTITDITDTTIQVKSDDNGIQQISISDDISYSSDEDLAIGDFIIAMGFMNGNKVLDTKRIISTDPPEPNTTQALWANISSIEGKNVSFTTPGQDEEIDITFPKTWVGPDVKDLEEGQNYIMTGILSDNTLALRSIFELE